MPRVEQQDASSTRVGGGTVSKRLDRKSGLQMGENGRSRSDARSKALPRVVSMWVLGRY